MRPAALAFDAAASTFDARFGQWQSVLAQRTAVRESLIKIFPPGGTILEIGGGTGEDAVWLAQRGFKVLSTDAAPAMVETARRKLAPLGSYAEVIAAEDLERFSSRFIDATRHRFDGAFSNFAGLNCVDDLRPVARGLARLLRPGAAAVLVLFGKFSPGEIVVECLRRRPRQALRRFRRGAVPASIGGHDFTVRYHEPGTVTLAMHPWFRSEERRVGKEC